MSGLWRLTGRCDRLAGLAVPTRLARPNGTSVEASALNGTSPKQASPLGCLLGCCQSERCRSVLAPDQGRRVSGVEVDVRVAVDIRDGQASGGEHRSLASSAPMPTTSRTCAPTAVITTADRRRHRGLREMPCPQAWRCWPWPRPPAGVRAWCRSRTDTTRRRPAPTPDPAGQPL